MKHNVLTIPNVLSGYRLLMFPVILLIAIQGNEKLFTVLLCINLVTDILDGFIARRFNMQTKIGAWLDSSADIGSFILAFIGIWLFKWEHFSTDYIPFLLFLGLYIFVMLFSFLKFKRNPSLHLYSCKTAGYFQGVFIFVLFAFSFYQWFYYVIIIVGVLAYLEQLIVLILLPKMQSNVKGLYWVLKSKRPLM